MGWAVEERWHRHAGPGLPTRTGMTAGCWARLCLPAPLPQAAGEEMRSNPIFSLELFLQPRRYLPAALSLISCCSEQRQQVPLQPLGWEGWKIGRKGADRSCPHRLAVLPSPC